MANLNRSNSLIIMNRIFKTAIESALRSNGYESPEVVVTEIHSEGVLCASGQFEEWNEETLNW